MGVVYKARQASLSRLVALKMIRAGSSRRRRRPRRFQNEAEAVALLDHPGSSRSIEVGEYDDQHYFSMKLIEGESLAKHLGRLRRRSRRGRPVVASPPRPSTTPTSGVSSIVT